jgi:N-acetylglucosaminyl-diphospho-decaprenol L-rhamnosyltransferase
MNVIRSGGTPAEWTVITVSYNSAQTLQKCWSDPVKPFDWIVVDNCSSDTSVDVAQALGARLIRLPENVGFAAANNIALRQTASPYVLFANPDLVVSDGGFAPLRAHLERFGGLAAPQLLSADGEPQPNGRGFPYATAKLGNRNLWPFSRLHASYRIVAAPNEAIWVSWMIGAAVAARRSDFIRLGAWNERYFLYYEDAELGLRAWQNGQPVALLGDVRWTHHWARATNTFRWSKAHSYEIRAARTFYRTHPEFLFGLPAARRRHALAATHSGQPVTGGVATTATPLVSFPATTGASVTGEQR